VYGFPVTGRQFIALAKRLSIRFLRRIRGFFAPAFFGLTIPLAWDVSRNWGDSLSPFLVHKLTGRTAYQPVFKKWPSYVVIGSILGWRSAHGVIWGAGFISSDSVPNGPPKKIYAVRGPLTRKIFLQNNIECPTVYGDPAILLGSLVPVVKKREFRYGIIPHYVDKNNPWINDQLEEFASSALLIDIEGDILEVIDQVTRCEFIFSSSLHGLICADTYNIPNTRLILSSKIKGGDFKFVDYRLGIGAEPHAPARPAEGNLNLETLAGLASLGDVTAAASNLLASSPFRLKTVDLGPLRRL